MLKIGYFGDGIWAQKAFDLIVRDAKFKIMFVVLRHKSPDSVLREKAAAIGIPCYCEKNVNDYKFLTKAHAFGVDINVSMSFDQILKNEIICLPPLGFINCHAGALPFYRGRNVLNWAIINGEKEFGVTVHHVDDGIDTGDIILQRFAPIETSDDYGDVLKKAHVLCATTLYDALKNIETGTAQRIKQSTLNPCGFYCSGRTIGDEYIDWSWSSKRICDFVRGIAFPAPGARTFLNNREYIIAKAKLVAYAPNYIDKVGNVVGKRSDGVVVKTGDNIIIVERVIDVANNEPLDLQSVRIGWRFKQV